MKCVSLQDFVTLKQKVEWTQNMFTKNINKNKLSCSGVIVTSFSFICCCLFCFLFLFFQDWVDHINTVNHTAACRDLRNK